MVAESCESGSSASLVARRHDINAILLFTWRRQMRTPTSTASPLELVPSKLSAARWLPHQPRQPGRNSAAWLRSS
ncbi:MAG: hypothetical protein E5X53_28040 [Mesorhizobium sp.]|uniref:transposase n=1 Tax=Mesorhizobium sp. TaxID=1871066 RepID=UPI00121C79AF|nr:MAG: hypothetical protein E5X53_28040 [Mesorhizobium sp.]